ncbi:unnamed protein product [Phytomonas sp. EM1]|nr:unnamed protein product [Phytomonas sp. EM1]|eukprot:CCW63488.1 unnamed protein product [Phytomonas sp. isolate EM1]
MSRGNENGVAKASSSHANGTPLTSASSSIGVALPKEEQYRLVSARLRLPVASVRYTLEQSRQGATVPFLARYRQDETGQLDETQLRLVLSTSEEVTEVHRRRQFMLKSLEQRGLLTEGLQRSLENMVHLSQLEDVWEPFKVKKTSLASRGRDAGLGPFAEALVHQGIALPNQALSISRVEDGRRLFVAILAEEIQRCDAIRQELLRHLQRHAHLTSVVVQQSRKKVAKEMEEDALRQLRGKFQYYDGKRWPLHRLSSHNILALQRGETKGILRVDIEPDHNCERLFEGLVKKHFSGIDKLLFSSSGSSHPSDSAGKHVSSAKSSSSNAANRKDELQLLREGLRVTYEHLLKSIKNTIRRDLKKSADQEAILVFEHNLRYMLLQRPLSRARILAMDPGITNGIKCVALDENGEVMSFFKCTLMDEKRMQEYIYKIVETKKLNKILIGNGTASQQTALLVAKTIQDRKWTDVEFAIVSEAGASVYSVSDAAKEEFPTLDIMYRGAVNIGRRVLDPLSELVKIPVRSMGIGMYQHDVNEKELLKGLNHVVESCVALVGINASSSNRYVMEKVPGIQKKLVDQIVLSRHTKHLNTREDLRHVPGMTELVYNQIAGFFRFPNSPEPLDNTNIHPESYHLVRQLMEAYDKGELGWCAGAEGGHRRQQVGLAVSNLPEDALVALARRLRCGLETLRLVGRELLSPGLDPRASLPHAGLLRREIKEAKDLQKGDLLTGMVQSVTTFGAFVDFGLHDAVLVRGPGVDRLRVGELLRELRFTGLDHLGRVQVEEYHAPAKAGTPRGEGKSPSGTQRLHLEAEDWLTPTRDPGSDRDLDGEGSGGLAAHLIRARRQEREREMTDPMPAGGVLNDGKRPRTDAPSEGAAPGPSIGPKVVMDVFSHSEEGAADTEEGECDATHQHKRQHVEDGVEEMITITSSAQRQSNLLEPRLRPVRMAKVVDKVPTRKSASAKKASRITSATSSAVKGKTDSKKPNNRSKGQDSEASTTSPIHVLSEQIINAQKEEYFVL